MTSCSAAAARSPDPFPSSLSALPRPARAALAADAKRNEMKRNEIPGGPVMTTATAMPENGGSVPAGDGGGRCKRAACGRPLPPGERGRSRQFCSDECRIRHYNAMRGTPAAPAPPAADGPEASLSRLAQLLTEASRLASAASAQVAAADPGRVAAVLADAEAARRRAEAHAATTSSQAAESAESADAAWEAPDTAQAAGNAAGARAQAAEERAREL